MRDCIAKSANLGLGCCFKCGFSSGVRVKQGSGDYHHPQALRLEGTSLCENPS
ncbi:hypothetical protein [uncultured Helicobacter sp.]|uniref:hypothetical protein n=1 Tax=uncultured Helicobacter sp. TaxID=175537 RepID=UPI001C3B6690|nr:hypothetical protein [Candidatus Helicobacter avicola]